MVNYLLSFLICGSICAIAQIIYEYTKFTPGHITSLFVILGSILDIGHIYDKLLKISRVGASLPITSFGHSLTHAAYIRMLEEGFLGIFLGIFDLTSVGIGVAIFFAFLVAITCKPRL